MTVVNLGPVKKQLRKLPKHIKRKLLAWARDVEKKGIGKIRKIKGFHDEPLRGKRFDQRSIRLSLYYRAIYRETKKGKIDLIIVEEVNKHEY